MKKIAARSCSADLVRQLGLSGLSPLLSRIYAARGITDTTQLDTGIQRLLPCQELKNAEKMAVLLADAIGNKQRILIIADYDADGATACAIAMRGLSAMGAQVDFIVPNRFEYGYI